MAAKTLYRIEIRKSFGNGVLCLQKRRLSGLLQGNTCVFCSRIIKAEVRLERLESPISFQPDAPQDRRPTFGTACPWLHLERSRYHGAGFRSSDLKPAIRISGNWVARTPVRTSRFKRARTGIRRASRARFIGRSAAAISLSQVVQQCRQPISDHGRFSPSFTSLGASPPMPDVRDLA